MEKQESRAGHGNPVLESLCRRMRHVRADSWKHQPRRGPCPLVATITGAGSELRTADYDWDGRRRGDAEWALVQYTLAGEGRVTLGSVPSIPRPATVLLLTFPDDNRYWLPEGQTWEHFYVCLAGREAVAAIRLAIARKGTVIPLPADAPATLLLASACERMIRGQLGEPCENSAQGYSLAMALLAHCTAPPPPSEASAPLGRAIAHCQEQYAEDIAISDLARIAGYSRYHFTRLFKQAYGLSPTDYLCDLRIAHASRLLRESDATVRTIAGQCGFADPTYFCKVFRRAMGISPGSFRRSGIVPGRSELHR